MSILEIHVPVVREITHNFLSETLPWCDITCASKPLGILFLCKILLKKYVLPFDRSLLCTLIATVCRHNRIFICVCQWLLVYCLILDLNVLIIIKTYFCSYVYVHVQSNTYLVPFRINFSSVDNSCLSWWLSDLAIYNSSRVSWPGISQLSHHGYSAFTVTKDRPLQGKLRNICQN